MTKRLTDPHDAGDHRLVGEQVLSRPYAERRIVLISPSNRAEAKESEVNWTFVREQVPLIEPIFSPLSLFGLPRLVAMLLRKVEQKPAPSISGALPVPLDLANKELAFPPGHPLLDQAYVGHPLDAPRYIPLASFHQQLFEQKVNDLVTLLASLGAQRIRVCFRQGYRAAAGIRLGVDVPGHPSGAAEAGSQRDTMREAVFEETYAPTGLPSIPKDLVWYEHEPSWKALARRRLEHGLKTFNTELTYIDDYGVNAELKVGIEKLGFRVGGDFSKFESTRWEFEGTFNSN